MCKVSVIMGIYNCAPTLQEALDSLYAQTFQDFEIILCDDGSKDCTYEIALDNQKQHPNIVLLQNDRNMGLNYTLNRCLAVAQGEYIARMDGDDISLPARFEKEVKFLDTHPEYAIVSTPMIYFDENGEFRRGVGGYEPQSEDFINGRTFCHAPCMVRREAYFAVEGYTVSKYLLRLEDQHLWLKMYQKGFRGYNIEECLYMMRDDKNATIRRDFVTRRNEMLHRLRICKTFKLPWYRYIESMIVPTIKWLLPYRLYTYIHQRK